MFLHTYNPQPILDSLGPLTVHWYGLTLSLAALAGFFVLRQLGRRYGLRLSDLETLFFWIVIAGIIGARLYHVLNEWGYYTAHPADIVKIWNGGLAIHGGVLAGLVVVYFFARKKKISGWLLADLLAPALALGQAIGRWGNYFNQELFGRPTDLPWGIPIDAFNRPPEYILSKYFHPTFLYESLGSLAVFVILIILHRKRLNQKNNHTAFPAGLIVLIYFIMEPLVRIGTEWLRIDRVPIIAGVRLPLLVSIIIAMTASVLLFRKIREKT